MAHKVNRSACWRNSVRRVGAIPFGVLAQFCSACWRYFVRSYFTIPFGHICERCRHARRVDSRTTSGAGRSMRRGGRSAEPMRSRSVLYATFARSAQGWCTVVSGGDMVVAYWNRRGTDPAKPLILLPFCHDQPSGSPSFGSRHPPSRRRFSIARSHPPFIPASSAPPESSRRKQMRHIPPCHPICQGNAPTLIRPRRRTSSGDCFERRLHEAVETRHCSKQAHRMTRARSRSRPHLR